MGLSGRFIWCGYPGGLSDGILRVGYPVGLSGRLLFGGGCPGDLSGEMSEGIIRMGYPMGIIRWWLSDWGYPAGLIRAAALRREFEEASGEVKIGTICVYAQRTMRGGAQYRTISLTLPLRGAVLPTLSQVFTVGQSPNTFH